MLSTIQDTNFNAAGDGWVIKSELDIHTLTGDGEIKIGDFEVEYFATPGHSPCCECYKIGDMVFAGDTLFNSGIGRLDLKGASKEDMIKSLEKLSKVEFSTLYSGHGEASDYDRQKRNIAVFTRFLKR